METPPPQLPDTASVKPASPQTPHLIITLIKTLPLPPTTTLAAGCQVEEVSLFRGHSHLTRSDTWLTQGTSAWVTSGCRHP